MGAYLPKRILDNVMEAMSGYIMTVRSLGRPEKREFRIGLSNPIVLFVYCSFLFLA